MLKPVQPMLHGKSPAPRVWQNELHKIPPVTNRVAVLLNSNARQVTRKVAHRLGQVVGRENLFFSQSLEQAEGFAREIVQRGYGTVVCGGGDGTLVRSINLIQRYIEEANSWRMERWRRFNEPQELISMPHFAFLGLGTGNGMKGVIGAQDPVKNLEYIVQSGGGQTFTIPMITNGQDQFLFGGVGYDSLILNDYNMLKSHTRNPVLKPIMHSVMGYFAAILGRTIPRILTGRAGHLEARITTQARAFYIDPRRGDASIELEAGSVLFEGPVGMVGAGTIPFFGYGFKAFPFAQVMPGMMNLRIATLGPLQTLAHLPSVWSGSYRNPTGIYDFFAKDVKIELSKPFPFQHSGDDQGEWENLHFKIAPENLQLVDYLAPRNR